MSGSNNYEVSSRKSRKRKDSASGKSIHSPSNRSQKKIVLVDEAESLTDSKIFPKSRQEAFVVIEEDPKEEAELDQNEELAEQFKEKHARLKKDAGKQIMDMKKEEIHDKEIMKSETMSTNANKNFMMKPTLEDISEGEQSREENDN